MGLCLRGEEVFPGGFILYRGAPQAGAKGTSARKGHIVNPNYALKAEHSKGSSPSVGEGLVPSPFTGDHKGLPYKDLLRLGPRETISPERAAL